eukprot:UC4_evm6s969
MLVYPRHFVATNIITGLPPYLPTSNPLKGFLPSPEWTRPPYKQDIRSDLEFYYISLASVLPEEIVPVGGRLTDELVKRGLNSSLEPRLAASRSRNKQAIVRFFLDYPSNPSGIPPFLRNRINITNFTDYGGGESPDYQSEILIVTLEIFVAALGKYYDGDPRLGFVQIGLLGHWGEWHVYPKDNDTSYMISDTTKNRVATAFENAFDTTKVVMRYPHGSFVANGGKIGLHDDSFIQSTLDGKFDTGNDTSVPWYFWSRVRTAGATDFWKTAAVGGELRPELQPICFSDKYLSTYLNEKHRQLFSDCAREVHLSWLLNHHAFATGYSGLDLQRAVDASANMGYNFFIHSIHSNSYSQSKVKVTVTVENRGVAPFYYPLSLVIDCDAGATKQSAPGLDGLIAGLPKNFSFIIPSKLSCLSKLRLSMESPYVYNDNSVKFAQGFGSAQKFINFTLLTPPTPTTSSPTYASSSSSVILPNNKLALALLLSLFLMTR